MASSSQIRNLRLKYKIQVNKLFSNEGKEPEYFVNASNLVWSEWHEIRLKGHWDWNPQVSLLFLLEGEILLDPLCLHLSLANQPEVCSEALVPLSLPSRVLISWDCGFGCCCFSLNLTGYQVSEQMWACGHVLSASLWNAPEVHTLNLFDILQDRTQVGEEKIKERKGITRFS